MKRHIEELPYGTTLYTQLSEFRNPARIRKNTVRERPFEDDPYTCMQTNLIEDTAMKFRIFLLLCASLWGWNVRGQSVALKTNVLSDAFMNINLGVETGLAPKWTLDITGDFNAWTLSHGRRWKHWLVRPSAVMVLRPFCRTFHRFPRARRAVQHRRREKWNLVLGFRSLETFGLPLSGLVHRRRRRLRIRLDTRQALEPRSRNRRGIRLHAI